MRNLHNDNSACCCYYVYTLTFQALRGRYDDQSKVELCTPSNQSTEVVSSNRKRAKAAFREGVARVVMPHLVGSVQPVAVDENGSKVAFALSPDLVMVVVVL